MSPLEATRGIKSNTAPTPPALREPDPNPTRHGVEPLEGILSEEKLPQLANFQQRMLVYKEMMHDHVIGTLFDALSFPILSAEFNAEDPTNTREGRKRATFLEEAVLGLDDIDLRKHAEEMLDFTMYGFAISEMVLRQRSDGKMVFDTLMPVAQETLWEWGELDVRGRPVSFAQRDPVTGGLSVAPMTKLVHMTYRSRKRSPEGTGILRSLYRPWYFRKNIEVLEAIGAERDVGNVPYAEVDKDASLSPTDIETLEEALKALRIDEAAYLIGAPGVNLKPFGAGGKVYDFRQIIRDWYHNILRRFFADFLATDNDNLGNTASAKELTGFFALGLRYVQKQMLDAWNAQLVPYLFAHNPSFGLTERDDFGKLPKLTWSRVGRENVQALATTVGTLIDKGVFQPDDDLEDRFRDMMEMPKRKDDRTPEERALNAGVAKGGLGAGAGRDGPERTETPRTRTRRGEVQPETRRGRVGHGGRRKAGEPGSHPEAGEPGLKRLRRSA